MAQDKTCGWNGKVPFILFLVLLAALGFIFRDAIISMTQSWQKEEYSHGYLIPLLSLLLLLNKIPELHLVPRASWLGGGIIALCIAIQFIFQFAGVYGLSADIFLFALIGLFALFWGDKSLRPLAAPLALLFFCAPLPKLFFYTLSFNMQMMSSSVGTFVLTILGVPVFQDGNLIDLGGYQLEVAEACNGLRYLFPLIGLSFLLAYLYEAPFWKRAFVFASAAPVAILMNGLRIALIGVTVDLWGSAMAEGLLHEVEGVVVFMGCILFLLAEIFILQKIGRKGYLRFDALRLPSFKNLPNPAVGKPTTFSAVALIFGVIISVVLPQFLGGYLKPVPLSQPLSFFPLQIGAWVGSAQSLDPKYLSVLGTQDYFIADYSKNNQPPVNLYMLYYQKQDSTSNQAVHSPSVCIPAGGWAIDRKSTETLSLDHGQTITVNKMLISKGSEQEVVYYWFNQDGMPMWSPDLSKFIQMKNAVTKGRSDGAMIRLVAQIKKGATEQDADRQISVFLQDALPRINHALFPTNSNTANDPAYPFNP